MFSLFNLVGAAVMLLLGVVVYFWSMWWYADESDDGYGSDDGSGDVPPVSPRPGVRRRIADRPHSGAPYRMTRQRSRVRHPI